MLASQKENIWREKGKNNVVPLLKDKMLFNSKCQHQKTKKLIKKKSLLFLFIYLAIYQKTWKKCKQSKTLLLSVHPHHKTFLPSKLLLVKLFGSFFPSCTSISDHKCIACAPCWLHSTFVMRPPALKCKWRTILHWFVSVKLCLGDNCSLGLFITVTLTGSASQYGHSMSLEIKQNELYK